MNAPAVSKFGQLFVSIEGTDCPVHGIHPFTPDMYSHKFNRAGLRYELGVSIHSGLIVWVSEPFKCAVHNDLSIFKSQMAQRLNPGEKVVGDKGYNHVSFVTNVKDEDQNIHERIRERHEVSG